MKIQSKILTLLVLSVVYQSAWSIPFTFEGRSLGMGSVSVATSDLATASWANPAMLTNQRRGDDFSLLIGVGAFIRDDDDLISDIENYQAANDRLNAATDPQEILDISTEMLGIVQNLDGKNMAADVSGVAAVGMAFETFAMSLSVRADAIGAGNVTDLATNIVEVTDPTRNILNLEGVIATEFGVSIAKAYKIYNRKVSIGIKPKMIDLQAFTYRESILNTSSLGNVFDNGLKLNLGSFTSFDLGLAVDYTRSLRFGLNIQNLLTDAFDVGASKLNFDTNMRIGVAYQNRYLTVAADYDLTENSPLLANPAFEDLKTQYLAVGAEFNAFDFAQLRLGARKNLAGNISTGAKTTALTAGAGFWLGFNLDVAATFTDNAVGAFVQSGFRF